MAGGDERVCPFCGRPPGAGVFCASCGRNLAGVERLPTRAAWEAEHGAEPPGSGPAPSPERCADATRAFLEAMHAAGDPGATRVFESGWSLRHGRRPRAWVLRPVRREPEGDYREYEAGLVLTVTGDFHRLESQVRGWGQRDFPVFHDSAAPEPIEMPVEHRLIAELETVLRENGVDAPPPLASP